MAEYNLSATLRLRDNGMSAGLKRARTEAEKLEHGIGDLKNEELLFRVGVEGMEKLKRYHDALKKAGMKIPPIEIRARDEATPTVNKIRQEITSLTSKAHTVAVNLKTNGMAAFNRVKGSIGEMAGGAAMAAGAGMMGVAGLGFGAVNAVNTYKDFDYQMKRNKALFTTGLDAAEAQRQYVALEEAARHYGATTKFTASEVGKAEEYMALAGWDADTSIKALPAVLNAAVASGEDLGLVSDIITDDMTAMGYQAGEMIQNAKGEWVEAAQHFSDVMLRTTLRSNTNFQMLGLAMKYAAPLAHTLGYNIEEVSVALGLMANNGIKADQAGTGLRGIMNRFISEPKKAAEAMEELGVSMFDAQGKAKGLMPLLMDVRAALRGDNVDAMIDFAEKMTGEKVERREELTEFLKEAKARGGGKLSAQDQARLGSMLSGTYALSAFMAIMNSSDADIQKLMTEIYKKSDGTGAEIQKEMMDTLQGDLDAIKAAWEDFDVELFKGKGASGLREFVQAATRDINSFKESLKDGLDIGDIGGLAANVLSQLKNKFLELDGVGSLLAGGALMVGLRAILKMGLKVKDTLSEWSKIKTASDLGNQIRGNKTVGGLSSVGTMNIKAGVVNLSGNIKNFGGKVGNQGYVDSYYKRRGEILAGQNSTGRTLPQATSTGLGGLTKNGLKVAGGGMVLSGIFGAIDVAAAKNHSAETLAEAKETVAYHRQVLENLKNQGAEQAAINKQMDEVRAAEDFQRRTVQMNNQVERQAEYGAVGSVLGTAIGAGIGSVVPVIGTTIGGIIGGVLGDILGSKAADIVTKNENNIREKSGNRKSFFEAGFEEKTGAQLYGDDLLKDYSKNVAQRRAADEQERQRKKHYEEENKRWLNGETGDAALAKAHNDLLARNENFAEANAAAEEKHLALIKRGAELAKNRDKIGKEWQKATGFSSLYGGNPFALSSEEDRAALAAYDKAQSDKKLQEIQARHAEEQAKNDAEKFSIGDFLDNLFFSKAAAQTLHDEEQGIGGVEPLASISEQSSKTFNVSDILPDFNFSEWLSEKTADIDLASILPDFSGIGELIAENFSQIPTAASEAFNTISTSASEGIASIQSAWNELPGFFDGLFGGLGGVASGAGAAIASGINSGIVMIQSAWEGLSSWLSSKISSLSSMASNAAAAIGINIAHNAKGTSNFEGGWSEVNEHGGELMLLPSGTKIYPHSTTKKLLRNEIKEKFSNLQDLKADSLGNIEGLEIPEYNRINSDDDLMVASAKRQAQLEQLNSSQATFDFDFESLSVPKFDLPQSSTSNTTTNNNSSPTINLGGVNINSGMDFDEFLHKFQQLLTGSVNNSEMV